MSNSFLKKYIIITLLLIISGSVLLYYVLPSPFPTNANAVNQWEAPDLRSLGHTAADEMIRYGRELIANTALYLGPKGKVAAISNGMNCQNCHLEAGTRINANCYALVASSYPKFRDRSGKIESVEFRINDCFERSLNGKKLDSSSRELQAMKAYILWVGKGVKKGSKFVVAGTPEPALLDTAASMVRGELLYKAKCVQCHGVSGQGVYNPDSTAYLFPPLWGPNSFNVSAGIYRLSRMAGFIKCNMPYTNIQLAPQLSDEEAWDLAAFITAQPRTQKLFSYDWPKQSAKPFDYPFGPFTDSFSAQQHKFGPFADIKKAKEKTGK